MEHKKALSILGLNSNFTEEEFKASYRRLSKMYHPDKYQEGTELYLQMQRKQQEINEAREYIRDYLQKHGNTNASPFDIDNYVKEKLDSLKSIIKDDGTPILDEEFKIVLEKIQNKIYWFETDAITFFTTTTETIDRLYASCMMSIRMILDNFVASFYQKNYIDESEGKEQINYNSNLRDIYNQLLKIKDQYGKEEKIKKRLEDEIEQYKGYASYERLGSLVDVYKNNTLNYIKQNNFQNIEEEINKMHQQIKTGVFEAFDSLKKKISELETIVNVIDDEHIKNEYLNLYNSFEKSSSFVDTEKSIKKIQEMIDRYYKKQQFKEIEPQVNNIYQALIDRYCNVVKKYNITTDSILINNLNEFLNEILQLFIKGCSEYKNIDYFKLFNNITFESIQNDRTTIKTIVKSLTPNDSSIYIKNTYENPADDYSFFYLDEENMIIYKVNDGFITSKEINYEQLEEEYTPLEEFLKNSTYIGEIRIKLNGSVVQLLYQKDNVSLYRQGDIFHIIKNITLLKTNQRSSPDSEMFKDIKYICSLIEGQIKKKLSEYQGINNNRRR